MRETAVVLKTDKNIALVELKRKSACGENCAVCKGTCNAPIHRAKVINEVGAKAGDKVYLEAESSRVLKGALFVYMMPVLLMIALYIIAESITKSSETACVISVISLVISGAMVMIFDKHLAPKTKITQICDKDVK